MQFNRGEIKRGMDGHERKKNGHEKNIDDRDHADDCGNQSKSETDFWVGPNPFDFFTEGPSFSGGWIINKHESGIVGVDKKTCELTNDGEEVDKKGCD